MKRKIGYWDMNTFDLILWFLTFPLSVFWRFSQLNSERLGLENTTRLMRARFAADEKGTHLPK
jgi:hypothetical protein